MSQIQNLVIHKKNEEIDPIEMGQWSVQDASVGQNPGFYPAGQVEDESRGEPVRPWKKECIEISGTENRESQGKGEGEAKKLTMWSDQKAVGEEAERQRQLTG